MFGCTSLTVSYARELTSIFICYPQGDGFNTSLSRLLPDSDPLQTSVYKRESIRDRVWLCLVVRSCATQDDVNKDYVCTLTTSLEINRPPHPDRLAHTLSFGTMKHA